MNHKRRIIAIIAIVATVFALFRIVYANDAEEDVSFRSHIFSAVAPHSAVSASMAGAGVAMANYDGFKAFINPALTSLSGDAKTSGVLAVGYRRDALFDKIALPLGVSLIENGGAMGGYYGYRSGERGSVHDAAINFSGRVAEASDKQGPVEFGVNFRYEQSKWRRAFVSVTNDGEEESAPLAQSATLSAKNLLLDIGFYQQYLPGLDFALTFGNITGYSWTNIDGKSNKSGWLDGGYRVVTAGMLYSRQISGGVLLRLPVDIEMANLFVKSAPNKYITRVGIETQIAQTFSLRFGYAHAPENPLDLIADFDYRNIFFGGGGISVNSVQTDFFIGKNEFGLTATYTY